MSVPDSSRKRRGRTRGGRAYTSVHAAGVRCLERRRRGARGDRRRRARGPSRAAPGHDSPARESADDRGRRRARDGSPRGRRRARRAGRGRTRDRPVDRRRGARRARSGRGRARGLRGRRLAASRQEDRAEDRDPEALRRRHSRLRGHVRDRPGRNGQDVSGHGPCGRGARRPRRWAGSSSPARRSRPASGSATSRGRCSRRSTRTCARSSTPSTTCSTPDRLASYMEKGIVEVAPLAFMRGRTLNDSFIILDEAQNTSPEQMQMFLTRLGFGSKIVVTGDVTQVDLPREQASGPDPGAGHPRLARRRRVRPLRPRGRRPAQARPAHRGGVPQARGGDRHAASEVTLW